MKKSNGKDANNYTELHKTVLQQKPQMQTQIRPSSGQRIDSNKNLPPKQKQKYVVQEHMTDSRINQARVGLQLLKKKQSSKGISREKFDGGSMQRKQKIQKKTIYSNKNINNNVEGPKIPSGKYIQNVQEKPKNITKIQANKGTVPSAKNITSPKIETKANQQQYKNEAQQIAIKPKDDFYAILQRQMKKQQQNLKKQNINQDQFYQQNEGQLIQCSMGCGRKFNQNNIMKHQKVCQKVFQTKRKAFDSAQHRQIQQGFNQPKQPPPKKKETKKTNVVQKPTSNLPKWKLQSAKLRAGLKATRNQQLTKQQKQAVQQQKDLMIQCKFCFRKFSTNAGQRHIPFCQAKSKQMPKMNTTMKKTSKR